MYMVFKNIYMNKRGIDEKQQCRQYKSLTITTILTKHTKNVKLTLR